MSAVTITTPEPSRLLRVRRGVRAALALGVTASLVGNVLHASGGLISQLIAAWPSVALAVTTELITRVPVASRWFTALRILGTAPVTAVAAWVSYGHMATVASRYGEDPVSAHLIPLSVDGMIVVASVCLVEVGRHIRAAESPRPAAAPIPSTTATGGVLVDVALDVAKKISTNGDGPPTAAALARGLRDRGYRLGSSRIRPLADQVAARWAEVTR